MGCRSLRISRPRWAGLGLRCPNSCPNPQDPRVWRRGVVWTPAAPRAVTDNREGPAMPIFMDRHDMRGATAETVAEAHRRDLEVQEKYGVKYMTYWYDEARGIGFCLVEAPDAATAARVHHEAHGEVASDIIPVDL